MSDLADLVQLLRKMGHDMRVPLNTMTSTSDMLAGGMYDPLTPKQARAVTRLQRNTYRLLAILNDSLTYIRADASDITPTHQPFHAHERLHEWTQEFKTLAEEKHLSFGLHIAESVPDTLVGDETLVARIVHALLWNALSFTSQGSFNLSSDWTIEQGWRLLIKDTGAGIPESDIPHIFEPFWRGEERPQTQTAGAGLGLPLARSLARMMGGDVTLQQTGHEGSLFCVMFPFQTTSSSNSEISKTSAQAPD